MIDHADECGSHEKQVKETGVLLENSRSRRFRLICSNKRLRRLFIGLLRIQMRYAMYHVDRMTQVFPFVADLYFLLLLFFPTHRGILLSYKSDRQERYVQISDHAHPYLLSLLCNSVTQSQLGVKNPHQPLVERKKDSLKKKPKPKIYLILHVFMLRFNETTFFSKTFTNFNISGDEDAHFHRSFLPVIPVTVTHLPPSPHHAFSPADPALRSGRPHTDRLCLQLSSPHQR